MPRKGRRKQTRRVGTTAQGLLFDGPDREAENKRLQPEFVDRNPHDLVLANFREHLLQTGHGWVVEFRSLLRELDWQEFEERYAGGGRRPYAPWAMVGLILYGTMKAVSSVRNLEKLSQLDVGAMWITGGIFPDYSVICRFVQRHADSLTATFFEQLTSKILCQVGAGSTLAGDGTTIEAAGSRFQIIKREAANEAARVAREAAQANPASVRLEAEAQAAERVAAAVEDRAEARRRNGQSADGALACKTDPESTVQKLKRGCFAPAYVAAVVNHLSARKCGQMSGWWKAVRRVDHTGCLTPRRGDRGTVLRLVGGGLADVWAESPQRVDLGSEEADGAHAVRVS